jgi:hypothetical protein
MTNPFCAATRFAWWPRFIAKSLTNATISSTSPLRKIVNNDGAIFVEDRNVSTKARIEPSGR